MSSTPPETKKKKCLDCGNNQTNHTLSWLSNTSAVIVEPMDKIILGSLLGRGVAVMIDYLTQPYLSVLSSLRLISWNTDPAKASTARSRVIWEEAKSRGILMEQLVIFKKPVEFYRATLVNKKGIKKVIYFESIPQTKKIDRSNYIPSLSWMDDKSTLKKRLLKNNIPAPKGRSVSSWKNALSTFEQLEKPVIIKPRIGSRGRHTTTYISTTEDLKRAYQSAKKLCAFVIVEEHLTGDVYRGTCVNGTLVGVLAGMPARITGDGKNTIEILIQEKNTKVAQANNGVKAVLFDEKLETFLSRTGYTLQTIVPLGQTIDLSEKIGLSYGGGSRELFQETHPDIVRALESAARMIDAGVIGFDFIIPDPTADPENQKWGIIECNSLPFINLHHDPQEGTPINVAGFVWDEVIKNQ